MVKGGYYHAGQVCVSTQRIFVHADIQAEFVERFAKRVGALRVGDPLSLETEVWDWWNSMVDARDDTREDDRPTADLKSGSFWALSPKGVDLLRARKAAMIWYP